MNVKLYNALVDAHNFFIQDERNCEAIKKCEASVRVRQYEYNMHTPLFEEEKISWGTVLFLLWVFFPAGLIYIANVKHKNKANRKKHERKKQEILNSPEEIEYRNCKMKEIEEAKNALEQARQAREEYCRNNYEKCLSFLSDFQRNIETIDAYIHYVKTEQAFTLDEAWECQSKVLREIDEMRERREEREEQERRHRETQEALSAIAKNQEKINHRLETVNKYRNGTYRW